uniref:Polyhomeotic homolog 3 n=1 Tax=Sander lucioperca TaxID=283035 RepID=A0A8D0ASW6_SANLU
MSITDSTKVVPVLFNFLLLINVSFTSTVFPLLNLCVTWEMERQGPGEKQADTNRTVATTTPITSAAITMATVNSGSTTCTQVIQHTIHRPQSMAAQYLHQMYAAQQQHQLMLQTAALQQHQHSPHLQSLATIQKSPSSSSGSLVHQPAGVSQNSVTSPVTAHLIGRTQTSTGAATTISQQAMLLGNRPANCNQAQMYLRTQMVQIFSHISHYTCFMYLFVFVCLYLHVCLCITLLAAYSPVQTHTLVKQQLSCLPGQRVAHHQLILQQATGGAPNHRQLQPIALRVAPQETNTKPLSLSVKRLTTPSTQSQTNNNPQGPSSSSTSVPSVFASSAQTSIPAATVQPQPPPLVAAPQRRTSFPQVQNQPPPPPPPLVLPRLPQNPPASLQRLSLHSVQALAVHSGHMLLTEQELPVAEALVQMPYQNLPPPQTVAVNLKVHRVRHNETPSVSHRVLSEERKDECSPSPQQDRTLTSLIGRPVIRSPVVEEPSQLTTTSSNPPPLPPPVLPAAARGPTQPPSSPTSVPESPDRILTTHVLTHLIEGFVIREGLEPFPILLFLMHLLIQVVSSSLLADQVCVCVCVCERERETNSWSCEVSELGESAEGVLQCEFCGSRGYAHTFLRSKRFCSMTCIFVQICLCAPQARGSFGSEESRQSSLIEEDEQEEEEEDEPPIPMTTRLRKQAERQREREREQEQRMTETISVSDGEDDVGCPSQWNVEQVFSYINSLPGGQDVAEEFRAQEIDGQALLLLTEEHMVSTMNLKLGPALKLCAHINSLKDA